MITTTQSGQLLQNGELVQVAYTVFQQQPGNLNPVQSEYPNALQGYTLLYNIQMDDFFGHESTPEYYGFIAQQQQDPGTIIIVFRGTQGWKEWWADLHFDLVPFEDGDHGNVEEGFYDIYRTIRFNTPGTAGKGILLTEAIRNKTLFPNFGDTPLNIAGHSLGGALATLCAADYMLTSPHVSPSVFTYASPKVGDADFVGYFNSAISDSYRVFNEWDIVPAFPARAAYVPVKGGIEINSHDNPHISESLPCCHALGTYLCMLGADDSVLGDCYQ